MKKLFLPLLLLISGFVFGQGQPCSNYQQFGSATTRTAILGLAQGQKGVTVGRYADTATANSSGCADYYPGTLIVTDSPRDVLWQRNYNATAWTSRGVGNIESLTFITDSSIVICYSDGSCDTIPINNFTNIVNNIVQNFTDSSVYNINDSTLVICNGAGSCDTIDLRNSNNYYFLNDSTLITCDTLETICAGPNGDSCYTQQICDTIPINPITVYFFQNGQYRLANSKIVEDYDIGGNQAQLLHNSILNTVAYNLLYRGTPTGHEPFGVSQGQIVNLSSSVQSFHHVGGNIYTYPGMIDNSNEVRLYVNYTDRFITGIGAPFTGDTLGFMYDRIGYMLMGNSRGGSTAYSIDNTASKQNGLMIHTLDTQYTDAVTIFGRQTPSAFAFSVNPYPTTTLLDSRIAVFKTDLSTNFLGKVYLTNGRLEPDTAQVAAANNLTLGLGNVNLVSGATTINAITTSGWQPGSSPVYLVFSGAPLVKNNTAGGAGTATILLAGLTDFQAAAGDVLALLYDGTNWRETNRTLAASTTSANANNGLTLSAPYIQLGQTVAAVGNPAILLSHREIPMGGFTLSLNASASQTEKIFQAKNINGQIRASINGDSASFTNTGGWQQSEIFGNLAYVRGINAVAIGNQAGAGNESVVIGRFANDTLSAAQNVLIGKSSLIASAGGGSVVIGNNAVTTGTGGSNVVIGTQATSSGGGVVNVGYGAVVNGINNTGVGQQVNINAAHQYSVALGAFSKTAGSNQMVIGGSINGGSIGTYHYYLGGGVIKETGSTIEDIDIQPTGSLGSDQAGVDFYINGAKRTGNSTTGGDIRLQTSDAGSTGTTLQSLTTKAILSNSVFGIGITSSFTATRLNVVDNTITTMPMVNLTSTSTGAASDLQKVLNVSLSGANVNSGQDTYCINVENTHTGSSSSNYGLVARASGGTTNVGVGSVVTGTGTSAAFYGTNAAAGYVAWFQATTSGTAVFAETASGTSVSATSNSGTALYGLANGTNTAAVLINGGEGYALTANSNYSSLNSAQPVSKFSRGLTSGIAADGIGGIINLESVHTDGTSTAAQILWKWTTAANASRESSLILNAVHSTATVDVLTLAGDGSVKLRPITATAASAITAAEGMLVFVSDTNGTFTSIGIWCYQNGAWKAL